MAPRHQKSQQHRCDPSNYEDGALQHRTLRLVESLVPDLPPRYRGIVLAHEADLLRFLFEKLGEDMDHSSLEIRHQAATVYLKADPTLGGYLASEVYAREAHGEWYDAHGTDQIFAQRNLDALADVYLAIVERRAYHHKPGGDPRPYIRKAVKRPIRSDREQDQTHRRAQHETHLTPEQWGRLAENEKLLSRSGAIAVSPEEEVLMQADKEEAEAIFASLPASEKERRYLRARWDGDDYHQIARDFHVSAGAARQAVSHFNGRILLIRDGCFFQALGTHARTEKPLDLSDHGKWFSSELARCLYPANGVASSFRLDNGSTFLPLTTGFQRRPGRLFLSYLQEEVYEPTFFFGTQALLFLYLYTHDLLGLFDPENYHGQFINDLTWHLPEDHLTGMEPLDAIITRVREQCNFQGTFEISAWIKRIVPEVQAERDWKLRPMLHPDEMDDFGLPYDPDIGKQYLKDGDQATIWQDIDERDRYKSELKYPGLQNHYYDGLSEDDDDDWGPLPR